MDGTAPVSSCLLCLAENTQAPNDFLDVQINHVNMINLHLPMQLTQVSGEIRKVCIVCWKVVCDFHKLHEFVSATQTSLRETKVIVMEDDPLTQGNFSEAPKQQDADIIVQEQADQNEDNFFYPEVKIEERELDQLPKIEVLETETSQARRLRKRTKVESEEETPNSSLDISEIIEFEVTIASDTPKKRRGRPRKTEVPKDASEDSPGDDSLDLDESLKAETATELDDDQEFSGNLDDFFTHSDDSSEDSSETDDDSDYELNKPEGEFAVIPKRTSVRPKKYKKRTKPAEPKVRMSRELLDQRKKQQEEWDSVIAKFFNDALPCSICNLLVHNFTEMQRHHRLTHQVDPGYMICCGRKFTQRKVLAEHVLVHWNPDHFKCITCNKSFQNSRHLESHQQVHTAKVTFSCDICSKVFLSKTAIDYHKLNKHVPKSEFKFSCTECNKRFLTERKLKNHMNSMHDPESIIICDKCGKQMRTKIILKKHQELMHSNTPRPEPELKQCQICNAWLKGVTGLKQHMKSIHIESAGEHRCHVCGKISPNARALRRHIYHNHECERKFKCTMCDKAFKRPQELKEHTSTHTGEVLYTCPNCPMTFFCSANMYKHRQRLHRAQYEADKNQPKPPNILQAAVGATAAMKIKLMQNSNATSIEADLKHF
ncbi:CG4282 [Drosophila busckii]|uniref:CG4282 n=1 Tax=Drosophila busckii TaxID=30019 RepID=A0A0M3QUZ7_DROBS|nr:transcription factor grauzone [Drosophila busckii]ALC41503.1 CG4282 [Drosophila busckii]